MNKIICIYFILLQACCIQNKSKIKKEYMDITQEVSVEKFQAIAAAILKEGDRKFYCNKYNNSPHYKIDGFDVYLDPVNQLTNWSAVQLSDNVSDYNTIVIQDFRNEMIYHSVRLKGETVVLEFDCKCDGEVVRKTFLSNYLLPIEQMLLK